MAYIGAETPNDALLKSIRKGTRSEQTMAAAEACRRNGVIPELSFMVAPPEDPEGETERTFDFIRAGQARESRRRDHRVRLHAASRGQRAERGALEARAALRRTTVSRSCSRKTPEEWTERRWVDYACHADAPMARPIGCAGVSAISSRCCAAAFRPYKTSGRPPGPRRRCAGSPAGAIPSSATIDRGSSRRRSG